MIVGRRGLWLYCSEGYGGSLLVGVSGGFRFGFLNCVEGIFFFLFRVKGFLFGRFYFYIRGGVLGWGLDFSILFIFDLFGSLERGIEKNLELF